MAKVAKKRQKALGSYDVQKQYSVDEAVGLVKSMAYAKFDESVDMAVRLGVNPKHADQMARGALVPTLAACEQKPREAGRTVTERDRSFRE